MIPHSSLSGHEWQWLCSLWSEHYLAFTNTNLASLFVRVCVCQTIGMSDSNFRFANLQQSQLS
jgi:hypothetical protein